MGRKRIRDLEAYKFSFDINGENKKALDNLTDNLSSKYGPIINLLISTFCRMPEDIKQAFLDFCFEKVEELENQEKVAGEYEKKGLEKEKAYYLQVAKIINVGDELELQDEKSRMVKIELKEGYLVCPADWILLNLEQAKNCHYAGVVECRNSEKYGIPHFVFFSNRQYGTDYDDAFINDVNEMCVSAWPGFREKVLEKQVRPIPDPENRGSYLNGKEYLAAPIVGHFHIYENGEIEEPPYGAVIVKTK